VYIHIHSTNKTIETYAYRSVQNYSSSD
jgi:hypothetical protein